MNLMPPIKKKKRSTFECRDYTSTPSLFPLRPSPPRPTRKGHIGGLIVLLALLAVVFYILFSIGFSNEGASLPRHLPITTGFNYSIYGAQEYVNLCLHRSTENALVRFGRRGGRLFPTDNQIGKILPQSKTSLLVDKGSAATTIAAPVSSRDAALVIGSAINASMRDCILDFILFTRRGFSVTTSGEPETSVKVTPLSVDVFYSHPFTIKKDTKQAAYQRFSYSAPLRLPDMMNQAQGIIAFAKDRPEDADLTSLLDTEFETIFFSMDNAAIVVMRDLDHHIKGAPYEFWFGIK